MAAGVSGSFVPKSLPVEARELTLIIGHGKTHLSLTSGDRRNAPGRVNKMLAERVLLLCFSALQKLDSAPFLSGVSSVFTTQPPLSYGDMARRRP